MLTQTWSGTDIIFCHFRPFFALLPHYWPQKLKFGKNVKNTWRYYPFTHVHHKSRSYDVWFLRYKVQRTEFFVILGHFYPLTLLTTQKIKIWKNEKNSWRYYHFKHEYHKWKSYGVWFLRYGAQQTEFFLILDHFLHFYTSLRNNPEMQNEKNTWRYHHFTQVYHKWQSYDIWFLRYEVHQREFFFVILGHFLPSP